MLDMSVSNIGAGPFASMTIVELRQEIGFVIGEASDVKLLRDCMYLQVNLDDSAPHRPAGQPQLVRVFARVLRAMQSCNHLQSLRRRSAFE
jgi:hypothetical protein